jgi:hypothetical protein
LPPEFSSKTIDALSKRVAHRCSNPDCSKLTVGPNTEPSKATSIGEAAHIYGAQPGSARYRGVMSDVERSMIANAIWLCRDCHGLIDRDGARYPAELILSWKSYQEEAVLRELGKPGELLRFQIARRETDQLGEIPLFIKQVIEEKADFWEYIATAELLDFYLQEPIRRANQLKKGLYTRPKRSIDINEFNNWFQIKISELTDEADCLKQLLSELMTAWGEPGEPGNPLDIVHACRLYGQCAQRFVDIAEEAMFVRPPEEFESIGRHFAKGALYPTEKLPEVSAFVRSIIAQPNPQGVFKFDLVVELPEGWPEEFSRLMDIGTKLYLKNNR